MLCRRDWLPIQKGTDGGRASNSSAGDGAAVVIGGKVFRKIDARSWDVGNRLVDMVEDGTDMQVLSPMPELLSHWLPADDAEYLADVMNDEIAAMIAQAPHNFAGIGMVCAQDVPRAVNQLQKVKALGFAGIEIGTHINGMALGSDTLFPLYEAAEALDLGIFVHPLHPAGMERLRRAPSLRQRRYFRWRPRWRRCRCSRPGSRSDFHGCGSCSAMAAGRCRGYCREWISDGRSA